MNLVTKLRQYTIEEEARAQKRRHLSHTGPANKTRGYCRYCEERKNATTT